IGSYVYFIHRFKNFTINTKRKYPDIQIFKHIHLFHIFFLHESMDQDVMGVFIIGSVRFSIGIMLSAKHCYILFIVMQNYLGKFVRKWAGMGRHIDYGNIWGISTICLYAFF